MFSSVFNWSLDHFSIAMIGVITFLFTMYIGSVLIQKYHCCVGVDQLNLVDIYRKILPFIAFCSACAGMLIAHQWGL